MNLVQGISTNDTAGLKRNVKAAKVLFRGKTPQIMLEEMKERFQTKSSNFQVRLSSENVTVFGNGTYEIRVADGTYEFKSIHHPYRQGNSKEYRLTSPKGSSVTAFFEDSSCDPWIRTCFQESPKHDPVEIEGDIGYQIGHYLRDDLHSRLLNIKPPEPSYDL